MILFTKTSKIVDRARPLHRINSPNFDPLRPRASGRGGECGCRSASDYKDPPPEESDLTQKLSPKILPVLPAWVPVEREGSPPGQTWESLPEVEREVEGRLALSQHAAYDFPLGQWHWWYDWNFLIEPAEGFAYIRAHGTHDNANDKILFGTVECEWDCGALGDYDFVNPGGRVPTLDVSGPWFGRDWAWPVGGEYIWLAGRWIYDCGHPDSQGRMRSELHPCKAIATARWEAVKFDENERHVPAIQFMFFACRTGGYWDFPNIAGTDYEFIVDLPEGPSPPNEYPIGHTPEFALNTLVVRPRLLAKFDRAPFTSARGPTARPGEADPEIELLPPDTPGGLPRQVKLRIPLTKLGPGAPNSYGVIVSLGWHDPERQQAETVKEVHVHFTHIEMAGDTRRFIDSFLRRLPGEPGGIGGTLRFVFRIGVNGRWHAVDLPDVSVGTRSMSLGFTEILHLAEDDDIRITCHGMEEDPSGEMLRRGLNGRTVKSRDGTPFGWEADIDQRDDAHASRIADQMVMEGLVDAVRSLSMVTTTSNDLGKVIPGLPLGQRDTPNPLKVKDLVRLVGAPRHELRGRLTARTRVEATEMSGEDYTLHYVLEYRDLPN